MPKASIIIPVYNVEDYIEQTLNSILDQSFSDYELIIMDDGSTDRTAEIVKSVQDNRIRYFYQENCGRPSKPRNRAIQEARGDIVFIFDSDDLMLPGKLENTVRVMEKAPQAGLCFTGFSSIDENNKIVHADSQAPYRKTLNSLSQSRLDENSFYIKSELALKALIPSNYVGTSGVAIRRDVFSIAGYFDEEVRNSDDYLMWQAIASHFDFIYLPKVYHLYRIRSGSISLRSIEERAPGLIESKQKMKKYHSEDQRALDILDHQIRQLHYSAGYSLFSKYKLKEARYHLAKAFRERMDRPTLFYLTLSLLPAPLLKQLKKLKPTVST
ncbi:MAG: glycosyltransferase [Marinobacter sp.]|uniref:glycosyltransferase family 2 protein n=1 Tax=Marinobacter sp. TaxID=50741 RepID=UPI002B277AC1|nr:glycosyltransferase [Marinobacter sp.]